MKKLLLLSLLVSLPAFAANKTFTWVAPTTYEDGSALPASQIAGYVLTCDNGVGDVTVTGAVTTFVRDFPPGAYACSLRTRATNGLFSEPSNTVSFTVPQPPPPRPRAPVTFSVN